MDLEEEEPVKGQPPSIEPAALEHPEPAGQPGEGIGSVATATDVALEQDA